MAIKDNIICTEPIATGISHLSFGEYILDNLRTNLDHVLQVDIETGVSHTAQEVLEDSIKVAEILHAYGIRLDDRVAIIAENHLKYLSITCGILYVGGIVVPINPTYTEREFRHMLEILRPRLLFVSRKTERIMAEISRTLPWKVDLIQLEDQTVSNDVQTLNELSKRHANDVDPDKFVPTPIADTSKQAAVILSSSGTTGLPKGVTLSHRNWVAFYINSNAEGYFDVRPDDHVLVFMPLFHGFGFSLMMKAICGGGTTYLMRAFDFVALIKAVERYRITYLPVPPPILLGMAKYPQLDKYDLSSLKKLICGAAPFPLDAALKVMKRIEAKITNGYGMTELTVVSNLSDKKKLQDGNVGMLLPGFLCKVVDQNTGQALGIKEIGELCFKGDQVMLGYYGNPKATAETIDKDNWLHSGDLGYYNEEGELYITGRVKELIKYKGFQVSPSQIEIIIQAHQGVKDAAVVGKPDENSGELPMAFVVKEPNSTVTAEEITRFTNGQLSQHNWLRGGVKFIDAIPKTATGKIARKDLLNLISKM